MTENGINQRFFIMFPAYFPNLIYYTTTIEINQYIIVYTLSKY